MTLVALADNCPLIRRAIKDLLGNNLQYRLLWYASAPVELFQWLTRKRPEVLILEPAISGNGLGLRLIEKLAAQHPNVPILVYTACAHQDTAVSSLQMGAAGFLTKDCNEEELLCAIQKLAKGQPYLSPSLMEHLAILHLSSGRDRRVILSAREQEVLEGLTAGLPLTAIAKQLSCSDKTVSSHRGRLLRKLGLHSNADLVRYVQNAVPSKPSQPPHRAC